MKKIILILLTIISSISISIADDDIVAGYRMNKQWYFVNRNGEHLFKPMPFYNIGSYSEGMLVIQEKENLQERWGYMDSTGQIAFYVDDVDMIYQFEEGMALTVKFKDPQGLDRLYGFIDKNGNKIVDNIYLDATYFNDGLAWVMNFEKRGFIDKTGKFKLTFENKEFGLPFVEGRASMHDSLGIFGFINKKGEVVVDYQYDQVQYYSEGLAPVSKSGLYAYIDKDGNVKIPHRFNYALPFKDDFAFAGSMDGEFKPVWGIINKNGNFVLQPEFEDTRDFVNGIACVKKLGKWMFIDNFGNQIIDKKFEFADSFVNGIAYANDGDKKGYIDLSGDYLFTFPENADIIIDLRVNRLMK
jgi:hypothetical protein